jgi:hypothetical protein
MMQMNAKRWRAWLIAGAALAIYPFTVLSYVYWHTFTSELPGGRHGPQDAYRHTLASAIVAYTLSPDVVAIVSAVMESERNADSRMDRQNNAIGAAIGARATSFFQINELVLMQVQNGRINAIDSQQTTWLPPERWRRLPI